MTTVMKNPEPVERKPTVLLAVDHGTDEDFRDSFIVIWVIYDEAQKAATAAAGKAAMQAVMGMFGSLLGGGNGLAQLFSELVDIQPMTSEEGHPTFPLDLITKE